MSDYISRQAAIKEVHKFWNERIREQPYHIDEDGYEVYSDMRTINTILECNKDISKRIESIPAADVVEVVRCRDCKHADKFYHCSYMNKWNTADGYCYCGVRR